MRERERNLQFRRVRFHLFEKDPFLLIEITDSQDSYTRLNLKEIEKLTRFLSRCELALFRLQMKRLRAKRLQMVKA